MRMTSNTLRAAALVLGCAALAGPGAATELVYYPLNPSFGGNPLNGTVLLNSAIATNRHTDPDAGRDDIGIESKTPLQSFNDTLERSILSRLAASVSSQILGDDGKFHPGTIQTDSFTITVTDIGNGLLKITTIDKTTGAITEFQVNS
ncbi:curli assembly protein CsgF [Castellaniella sp. GW247-6E4]|uniref:curli assembly protein CsgF n=1 Tax=Castellaniella sp. GW247-6E4 TaxID=3140380 RepID=UPI00331552A9